CASIVMVRLKPDATAVGPAKAGHLHQRPVALLVTASNGSSFTIDAAWLLPTQNVTGVVLLATQTRRTFVCPGIKYSVKLPVFGSRRTMRSLYSPPDHTSPFLSIVTSYGQPPGVGAHSRKLCVFVSNMPILSERFSPNHSRSWSSIIPRRGPDPFVGVLKICIWPVFASMRPTSSAPIVRK